MAQTDLLSLDRKILQAARALDAWRGELGVDRLRDKDDPMAGYGEVVARATIDAVAKSTLAPIETRPTFLLPSGEIAAEALIGDADPLATLRPAVASWCAHLHVARSIREATVARAETIREERDSDSYGRPTSMRAMLRALARPRQAGGVPEGRAAAAIEDLSPQMMDGIVDEESRRREAAELLGPITRCCNEPDEEAAKQAQKYLDDTADEATEALAHGFRSASRERKGATWVDAFFVRRAADVAEGWPNALTPRWLAELSRGTELFAGLTVDVKVDAARLAPRADCHGLHLAPPTGAWTFARALHAIGAALRIHGREARTPFSSHVLPHDVRPYVVAEAFQALASTPVFHARARGVAKAKAEQSARRLSTTRLLERRHLALRVRLAPELARGRRAFLEAFEGLATDALGGEAPREMAAFLGAPGPRGPAEDVARFKAFDDGDVLAKAMVERFDADWWRNPKAASWIRERCSR